MPAMQSTPCATPEAAVAMVSATASLSAPKGRASRIVSTNVIEMNGLWVATVTVEYDEVPDAEVETVNSKQAQVNNENADPAEVYESNEPPPLTLPAEQPEAPDLPATSISEDAPQMAEDLKNEFNEPPAATLPSQDDMMKQDVSQLEQSAEATAEQAVDETESGEGDSRTQSQAPEGPAQTADDPKPAPAA